MTDSVNLKEMFGDQFKVEYEESYYTERSKHTIEDPWLMVLLCQNGHICPWGGSNLAACTKSSRLIATRLKALPFVTVAQDGSDGANIVFDVAHFDQVAEIMKPRRRHRRLSDEERRAAAERLRQYQPAKGQSVQDLARQRSETARPCVPAGSPV
ncbi:MAG TPA: hypothetical protein VMY42_01475 [Thermoguttaceae bacterium]|nr:hypothetical protein [Thermoguttaceae bacterium]